MSINIQPKSHRHDENNGEHKKHGYDNSNHNSDNNVQVFFHFSNANYLSNSKHEFFVKAKFIVECFEPVKISLQLPEQFNANYTTRLP